MAAGRLVKRQAIEPRPDWQAEVERWGMIFHHTYGLVYWNEAAYYELSPAEAEAIERGHGAP